MFPSALALSLSLFQTAEAGRCDTYIRRAESASGASLIQVFNTLVRCDAEQAETNFVRFMTRATDAETLTALSIAAIEADIWTPVWDMPSKISNYEARDIVTNAIGDSCAENEKIATFLQGAYGALTEVNFARWEDAIVACESENFGAWVTGQIESPPARAFDGKYDTLLQSFLKRTDGAEALPSLQVAAIAAAGNGGPFDALIDATNKAVSPALGGNIAQADQEALSETLLNIANQVSPEQARKLAETMALSGDDAGAASLLPVVYADRQRGNGNFVYGAAAVEAGDCKGTQTAVIHFAELAEPGQRWVIAEDNAAPLRESRPRLKKCESEGDWNIRISAEPLTGSGLNDWVEGLEEEWTSRGYEVSTRSEDDLVIE